MFLIRPANGTLELRRLANGSLLSAGCNELSSSWNETKWEKSFSGVKCEFWKLLPDLRNMLVLILGTSDFGGGAGACGSSSFSESLPPELSIDTSVSIPTWSHPKTDLDLVASCFAFAGAFGGIGCEIDFLGSNSSGSSSGESSKSSLSLFSVKFTLILQDWKRIVVS